MSTCTPALDTCGCSVGVAERETISNRPGLPELAYRLGTQPTLLAAMVARLASIALPASNADEPTQPLTRLSTRSLEDPAIALLDAWATVADVLTFYQERIANEGFLRTATERGSVLELARTIGYELKPGVAAGTHLAFIIETTAASPDTITIEEGVKVQSVPGQGETAQTFETVEVIDAQPAWNTLKPQLTLVQTFERGVTRELYLTGIQTRLVPGDAILLAGDERELNPEGERWDFRIITAVAEDAQQNRTRIEWGRALGSEEGDPIVHPSANPRAYTFRQRASFFGYNAPDWRAMPEDPIKITYRAAYVEEHGSDPPDDSDWPDFEFEGADGNIDLDLVYPKILVGSWVALSREDEVELYNVTTATVAGRVDFTLTAKVTRLEFDTTENLATFPRRDTVVFAQSEELAIAEMPDTSPVQGSALTLDRMVIGLVAGKALIVTGVEAGAAVSEVVVLAEAATDDGVHTTLTFEHPLAHVYERTSVTIYGNVVRATHGESNAEVLGSGNGTRSNQRFTLKKWPLTFVSAPTASGVASTIDVRVNDILWQEVDSLFGQGPDAQVYTIRRADNAKSTVIFGDGVQGARLPSGQDNIRATYRSGLGSAGAVKAGTLTLLLSRPLGLKDVNNPVAAAGAEDPEVLSAARSNAPLTILTLDRIVSLRDYEDFARAFAGVGKARAVQIFCGEHLVVHVTAAAADGGEIALESDLYSNLIGAIDALRDRSERVALASYVARRFSVTAQLLTDTRFVTELVYTAARLALLEAFSFEARSFAQPVTAAEVVAVLQDVEGVIAVDLDLLALDQLDGTSGENVVEESWAEALLPAQDTRLAGDVILPAELLTINEQSVVFTELGS